MSQKMVFYFRIFLLLFFPLLAIFFIIQFSVHPFLSGHSTQKLISFPEDLPQQVVLLVIDSLRFSYSSRFPVVLDTMKQFPQSTFLAKSKVGSPTMTTQRIQSLMTGSQIFSIGNILRTFQASKVETDNLLWQLYNEQKTSIVFGDNTWEKLFDFTHSTVCPNSFDIFDINGCDQLIFTSMPPKIHGVVRNAQSANFIIAHFLGIDHVGHSTSSITHPKMQSKINQISNFLQTLFQKAENDTLFIVTGDHAMRSDGNHGGNSQQQTQTFIFGYYKGVQLCQQAKKSVFSQLELTSTLSILLNLPLPLNSIGSPILNLLPRKMMTQDVMGEMNRNLYKHYLKMLKFYGNVLSQKQSLAYLSQIQNASLLHKHQQILQEVVQKLNFLKFATPNFTEILAVTISLSVLVLFFLLWTFSNELLSLFFSPSFKALMNILCSGFSLFTLFSCYLSWHYTKNLSDSLLFGLLVAVLIGNMMKKANSCNIQQGFLILISILVLEQTEHDKSYEFRASKFRIGLIHDFLSSKFFCLLLLSIQTLLYFRYMNTIKHEQSGKLSSQKYSLHSSLFYIRILLTILNYMNFIVVHIIEKPIYLFPKLITFIAIPSIFILPRLKFYNYIQKVRILQFLVINLLALFLGKHFPLILLVCFLTEHLARGYSTYQIIMCLLAKCVWWWPLGNRYEYSGVDILRTYVYSEAYSTILNGLCLIIYISSPFLLNLVLVNSRVFQDDFSEKSASLGQSRQQDQKMQDEEESILDQSAKIKDKSQKKIEIFKDILMRSNYKYVSVLLVGLVGGLWATITNNQQLLFTIMCAPLLVLITLITTSSLIFILVLTFFSKGQ